MFYALGAAGCTVAAYTFIKCFCWQYRAQALIVILAIACAILFGLYNLPYNVSLTGLFFR